MKIKLLLLPLLFLCACAHTELRDARTGRTIFRTEADATYLHYKNNDVELTMNGLDHSKTNQIMGNNVKNVTTATGGAILTSGIMGLIH